MSSSLFPPKKVIYSKISKIVLVCDRAVNILRMLLIFSLSNAVKIWYYVTHSGYTHGLNVMMSVVISVVSCFSKPKIRLRNMFTAPYWIHSLPPLHFISEYVCFVLSGTLWTRNKITSKNQIHFPVQTCMRWCPNVQFIQIWKLGRKLKTIAVLVDHCPRITKALRVSCFNLLTKTQSSKPNLVKFW